MCVCVCVCVCVCACLCREETGRRSQGPLGWSAEGDSHSEEAQPPKRCEAHGSPG